MQNKLYRVYYLLLGTLLLHFLWLMASYGVNSPILPSPIAVYQALPEVWSRGMSSHLMMSLGRIGWGIGLSVLIAFPLALLMYRSKLMGRILESVIYFSYPIPKIALLPVVMLFCGIGELTKVVMIILIILFQLIVSLRDSLRAIPQDNFVVIRTLGASSWAELRHIILPAVLPDLLSALRIAIGTAVSILFVTETYGTSLGMGYYIVDAWMRIDYIDMYAGISMLSLLGFVLFILIDLIEYYACPWRR